MSPGSLALALAATFFGAALYVNLVEQPARLALDDEAILNEWTPSDRRGVALMAALALVSAIAGLSAYFESHDVRFLLGAIVAASSWPYTVFVMGPVNNQILALVPKDLAAARVLVWQWGLLEYGQTAIAVAAAIAFLWAL